MHRSRQFFDLASSSLSQLTVQHWYTKTSTARRCRVNAARLQYKCSACEHALALASTLVSLAQRPATNSRAAVTEAVTVFSFSCSSLKRFCINMVVHQPRSARHDRFATLCTRDTGLAFQSFQDVFPKDALPRGFSWRVLCWNLPLCAGNVRPARRRLSARAATRQPC